jgi:hypothetical protein
MQNGGVASPPYPGVPSRPAVTTTPQATVTGVAQPG